MTIPRVIALNQFVCITNFIELGQKINEHNYIQKSCNINVEFFPKTKSTVIKLSKYLRQLNNDIYIVFYAAGIPLISAILANDKPVVAICMGSDVRHFSNRFSFKFKRKLWRNTDLLIAKSSNLKELLSNYCKKLNVNVNYWGIDTSFFKKISKDRARHLLNLPSKFIILSPRAFTDLYSIDLIVDSFIRYKNINDNSFLILIGRTPDKDFLRIINQKLKNANLIENKDYRIDGSVEYNSIYKYFYASDVALSFAKSEGFPTTLFELFKCKCPTIIGEIPSLSKEIIKDERDVLFSKFEINDISNHLDRIYSDNILRNTLIDNGLQTFNKYGLISNNTQILSKKINHLNKKKSFVNQYCIVLIYYIYIIIDKLYKYK